MIYPLSGLLFGAILGAIRAKKRGGTTADMVQWGAANAVLFGIIGTFALVLIERSYT